MPKADLTKTHDLAELLFVPRDQRDRDWVRRLYGVIGDAAMTTTSDQILQGPDGFSYFVLNMPAPNRDFQPLSLAQVLDFCLENSLGLRSGSSHLVSSGQRKNLADSISIWSLIRKVK
jgi:hypothetical protein